MYIYICKYEAVTILEYLEQGIGPVPHRNIQTLKSADILCIPKCVFYVNIYIYMFVRNVISYDIHKCIYIYII